MTVALETVTYGISAGRMAGTLDFARPRALNEALGDVEQKTREARDTI